MCEFVCVTFCAAKKRWKSWRIFLPQKCALNAASTREKGCHNLAAPPVWSPPEFDSDSISIDWSLGPDSVSGRCIPQCHTSLLEGGFTGSSSISTLGRNDGDQIARLFLPQLPRILSIFRLNLSNFLVSAPPPPLGTGSTIEPLSKCSIRQACWFGKMGGLFWSSSIRNALNSMRVYSRLPLIFGMKNTEFFFVLKFLSRGLKSSK